MSDATIQLAAFGGVIFPIALFIEAPVMMFLPASTALCRNSQRYRLVRRVVFITAAALTLLHGLVCLGPIFRFITDSLLSVPDELKDPAWMGLVFIIPWTGAIAVRRFYQGVLIRSGRAKSIGTGTFIRFTVTFSTLLLGFSLSDLPGAALAALSLSSGALAEACVIWFFSRRSVRRVLVTEPRGEDLLRYNDFFRFYIPLALATIIFLCSSPIASASMSRMPLALSSLAVWPALNGFVFLFRSFAIALKEVVISLSTDNDSSRRLFRFSLGVGTTSSFALFLAAITPFESFLFNGLYALPLELSDLAKRALLILVPVPLISSLISWYAGEFTVREETKNITLGVAVFLMVISCLLVIGVRLNEFPGIIVFSFSLVIAHFCQLICFWAAFKRSSPIKRDKAAATMALADEQSETPLL